MICTLRPLRSILLHGRSSHRDRLVPIGPVPIGPLPIGPLPMGPLPLLLVSVQEVCYLDRRLLNTYMLQSPVSVRRSSAYSCGRNIPRCGHLWQLRIRARQQCVCLHDVRTLTLLMRARRCAFRYGLLDATHGRPMSM